jgi:proteic killer suppression protein
MVHYAEALNDLKAPPGNRLESLAGDLKGYFSIRVNDQWRLVFGWTDAVPSNVRVCDYH